MSAVSLGPNQTSLGQVFSLDAPLSAGVIKTPRQISNCIAWFDGSDTSTMSLSSNIVSSWSDKSVNNYILNSAQLSALPAGNFSPLYVANAINGLGAVYFDGSNDYMFVNSGIGLASAVAYTSFVVLSPRYLSATQVAVGLQATPSSGTWDFLGLWISLDTLQAGFDGGVVTVNTTSRNDNRPIINSIVRNGASVNAYLNGFQYATNTTVASTVNSGVARLGIGANTYNNGAQPYKGYICEIIIYNRALSDTERYQVQNYLANKWRIPLQQKTLTNRDLIFNKLLTCQNNNIPVIDKCYRVNPANATGSPLQSNFYLNDVSYMSSVISTTITLEAWVKPNSFTFYGSPGSDLGAIMIANSNFYLSIDGNGKFNAYLVGSAGSTPAHLPSTTSVTRHAWNHVVWTYDGAYFRWYLNGVLDKTSPSTYTLGTLTLTNNLGIGSEGAATFGRFLDGYVAGCKIYGRTLSPTEIAINYQQSKSRYDNLSNIVTTNLQAYLDSDVYSSYPGSGTSFLDLTGNGNYFQLTNSPTFVSSEPKTFSLSGASQHFLYYVSIGAPTGNTGLALPSANSWTCSFWFRTSVTNSNRNSLLSHMGSGPVYCLMGVSNSVLIYYHYNAGWLTKTATTNVADDNWHNAVFVNTGNTMTIYLDGVLEKSSFSSTTTNPNSYVNSLGGSWEGGFFNGSLSTFMYYNTNLSAAQILQNYNAQKFRFGR
jgi:hypothetical protein